MKKFENPTLDIEELKLMDVITTSVECDCDDFVDDCYQVSDPFSMRR